MTSVMFNLVKHQSFEWFVRPKSEVLRADTIEELRLFIADTLQIVNNGFKVFYDWNDKQISLVSNADLMWFGQFARATNNAVTITVKIPHVGPAPIAHEGVQCDGCNVNICGFRYKCMECPNFDLCQRCESECRHADHLMIRIPQPGNAAKGRAYCERNVVNLQLKDYTDVLRHCVEHSRRKSHKFSHRHCGHPNSDGDYSAKSGCPRYPKSWCKQEADQSEYDSSDPCTKAPPCMKKSSAENNSESYGREHHGSGHHGKGHHSRGRHGHHHHNERTAHSVYRLGEGVVDTISNELINGIGALFSVADVIMGNSESQPSQQNAPEINKAQAKPTEASSASVAQPQLPKQNSPTPMDDTPIPTSNAFSGSGASSVSSVVSAVDVTKSVGHESVDRDWTLLNSDDSQKKSVGVQKESITATSEFEPTAPPPPLVTNPVNPGPSHGAFEAVRPSSDISSEPTMRLFREMGFNHDETYLNNLLRRYDQSIAQVVKHLVENK